MELYKKYRPQTLDEVYQLPEALLTMTSHVALFHGSSGTGKTTCAIAYARSLGVEETDITQWNASDRNGVDDMRELLERIQYAPIGPAHFIILDEAHKLTVPAMQCLLTPLENVRNDTYFIFCTSQPEKMDSALKSRCFPVVFQPLTDRNMLKMLQGVVNSEDIKITRESLSLVVDLAEGNARYALQILEAIAPMGVEQQDVYLKSLHPAEASAEIIDIARAFHSRASWPTFVQMMKEYKGSTMLETIRITILSYGVAILSKSPDKTIAKSLNMLTEPWYTDFNKAIVQLALAW